MQHTDFDVLEALQPDYLKTHVELNDIDSLQQISKWISAVILERMGPTLVHDKPPEREIETPLLSTKDEADPRKDVWKAARGSGLSEEEMQLMFGK